MVSSVDRTISSITYISDIYPYRGPGAGTQSMNLLMLGAGHLQKLCSNFSLLALFLQIRQRGLYGMRILAS